uniref:Secreted protein n=1 Tax=Tetraselmis sp. GSL018 TaxID=582737 RepID=A0A061SAT8_9CHLO
MLALYLMGLRALIFFTLEYTARSGELFMLDPSFMGCMAELWCSRGTSCFSEAPSSVPARLPCANHVYMCHSRNPLQQRMIQSGGYIMLKCTWRGKPGSFRWKVSDPFMDVLGLAYPKFAFNFEG